MADMKKVYDDLIIINLYELIFLKFEQFWNPGYKFCFQVGFATVSTREELPDSTF